MKTCSICGKKLLPEYEFIGKCEECLDNQIEEDYASYYVSSLGIQQENEDEY